MSEPLVEVTVFDTTERDGAQSLPESNQFSDGKKAEIAHHIARLGIGVIEAGFPATLSDAEEVRDVAGTVGQIEYEVTEWRNGRIVENIKRSPVVAGLARAALEDIEITWDAVHKARRPRIHTFIPTDSEHMRWRFPDKTPENILTMGKEAVRFAKKLSADHQTATVEFSAEAASTTNTDYLELVIKEALAEGADVVNVPDTVGQRDPQWMFQFYSRVINWVTQINPEATISAHNHNDLNQAVANTNMLIYAAAEYARRHNKTIRIQCETTICGLGERAGNADVFPVVAGLFKFSPDMEVPIYWEFNPGLSVEVANKVMNYAGLEVGRQSPIVGRDINRHRSGIHSDGIIKGGHELYTPFDPTFWGHRYDAVHEDGKYQGKRGRGVVVHA